MITKGNALNYQESIEWLEGVTVYGKKDGLNNMRALMKKLGDVQNLLKYVHVAGTNGKGTVCALLSSMLQCQGLKVGVFSSPHLVDYVERIQWNREGEASSDQALRFTPGFSCISKEEFAQIAGEVREAAQAVERDGDSYPTFFQLLTAIAFVAFYRHQVDVVVLEVGVGGRLDATNIIEPPLACVIASISLDHTGVLGNTPALIAAEKAGIIKDGVPVIVGENQEEVYRVIREVAQSHHSPVYYGEDMELEAEPGEKGALQVFCPLDEDSVLEEPLMIQTQLRGSYQIQNIRTAVQTAHVLGLSYEAVDQGMQQAFWPGRMQWIDPQETRNVLGAEGVHASWILEGAHNEDGASYLHSWMRDVMPSNLDTTLVFSALSKKDIRGILKKLLGERSEAAPAWDVCPFKRLIFAPMDYYGGMRESDFSQILEEIQDELKMPGEILTAGSIREALIQADQVTDPKGLVIIAGSLYLAGEVLQLLDDPIGGKHV